jgi:cytochrome c-type biogenesis protein CcmH
LDSSVLERFLSASLLALMVSLPVAAREATPMASDPVLEARVMVIAEELRCLVCQNETIAASHADLAVDLRAQIRSKLAQGQTSQQILDFMVERYGDFVLYRPPLKPLTLLLWVGPFVLLLLAAGVLALNVRRLRRSATEALSPAELQRARQLLDQGGRPP